MKQSSDKPKQNSCFLYSRYGADFEPAYSIRHLDPDQHTSRNRYAVGIYDAYNPDVLFAEVLLIPDWTQPTLSQEEIRRNNGQTPAPEPILPTEFAIQLYNPDQQIVVKHKPATLTSAATWDFEMPQQSFRTPSHSALDRSQDDPTVSEFTPKLALKWKKDGRLSKDLGCYISGRALNPDGVKNKHKEPDITIAILKNLKEVTIYEPNMARVDIEDLKGFEVALLLGAVVIRDVYFGNMKDTFNILSGRKGDRTSPTIGLAQPVQIAAVAAQQPPSRIVPTPQRENRIPPTDPRTQWEIDRETERLRKLAVEEERQLRKREAEERRQIQKLLEEEDKATRQRQAVIDAETERLRKLYGDQDASAQSTLNLPSLHQYHSHPESSAYASTQSQAGPYVPGAAPQSSLLLPEQQKLKQKSSIFGFRRHSDQENNKTAKKKSGM